jgi:flavorubredoxin
MGRVLIVYASRTQETGKIAEMIAEGVRISGNEVEIKKASEIKNEDDLKGYDGYLFGSATYHGEMITSMKQILFIAERAELEGKAGGSFGSYGWSAEANERIFETMDNIFAMKMVSGPLMIKTCEVAGAIKTAHDYGRSITEKF